MKLKTSLKTYNFLTEHLAYEVALHLAAYRQVIWTPARPRQVQSDATLLMVKRTAQLPEVKNSPLVHRPATAWLTVAEVRKIGPRRGVQVPRLR
jgi:hypothetical protein